MGGEVGCGADRLSEHVERRVAGGPARMGIAWYPISRSRVVCDNRRGSPGPARRPGAGAVPGRGGACLAVRTSPAAFVYSSISASLGTHRLAVVATTQVLVGL